MPWFKVDDGLAFHRKVVAAGNAAMGLWVRAGAWSAHELTDGFVPDHMIQTMGTAAQAERLVRVVLWVRADGGFRFHEWNERGRQPTAQEVRAEREENAARQAEFRKKRLAQKNLAKATTSERLKNSSGAPTGSDETFTDDSEVSEPRNDVTPALVTPLVTGVVTGARPDPTRPSSPYGEEEAATQPPPAGGGGRRGGGGSRERVTPADLAATAHSPQAHTLVGGWAAGRGLLRPQQRELSKAVDDLLRQGAEPALIPAALDAAHDDPRWQVPAKSLRFAYEHVVRQQRTVTPAAAAPMNKTDARIAALLAGGEAATVTQLRPAIGDGR